MDSVVRLGFPQPPLSRPPAPRAFACSAEPRGYWFIAWEIRRCCTVWSWRFRQEITILWRKWLIRLFISLHSLHFIIYAPPSRAPPPPWPSSVTEGVPALFVCSTRALAKVNKHLIILVIQMWIFLCSRNESRESNEHNIIDGSLLSDSYVLQLPMMVVNTSVTDPSFGGGGGHSGWLGVAVCLCNSKLESTTFPAHCLQSQVNKISDEQDVMHIQRVSHLANSHNIQTTFLWTRIICTFNGNVSWKPNVATKTYIYI